MPCCSGICYCTSPLSHLLPFLTHSGDQCFTTSRCSYSEREWCHLDRRAYFTLLFEQNQLSMQGTEQKEFSFQPSLILNLLNTLSTTEITQQNWEEISPCWLQALITSKAMHYLQQRFCHLGICWARCFHTQSWSSSSFQSFSWLFKPIAITRISTLQPYSCTALITLSYHRSWFLLEK